MGTLGDVFELVRDTSYAEIEEESNLEVVIALGGNSQEVRDKLNRALNTRLESLWTTSPFRLIDTNERPKSAVDEEGGLFIYALYAGEHIPAGKTVWLKELATSPNIGLIVVVLPREEGPGRDSTPASRFNPLRLVGGSRENGGAGADGAGFKNAAMEVKPGWEVELEQLQEQAGNKLVVVKLEGLELSNLQSELLPRIVRGLPGRELALARRAPIFRNTVATHLVNNAARENAQSVLLANLTSGVPFISNLFGGGADFLLLTRNQFKLSHQLASVYGQKRDSRVEIFLELAPIVGLALVWRNLSRRSFKKLPLLLQALPKASIAYGATWLTGRVAQLYYASGRTAPTQIAEIARRTFVQATSLFRSRTNNKSSESQSRQKRSS